MWRLKWVLKWLLNRKRRIALNEVLQSPGLFWKAMFLKLIPGLHKRPVKLALKDGGVFQVRQFMTLYIFSEIFLDRCYDVPLDGVDEPVVVDIGANTGLFMLRAKQLWPDANLFCYEPYPPNFDDLSVNLADSRLGKVQLYPEGVGGDARETVLHINPKNIGGHSIINSARCAGQVAIKLVNLRTVLDRTPHGKCDLMKLDCEGAEQEILSSMDQDLAARIPRIIYEETPELDTQALKSHLGRLGYQIQPHSGLVLASRRSPAG